MPSNATDIDLTKPHPPITCSNYSTRLTEADHGYHVLHINQFANGALRTFFVWFCDAHISLHEQARAHPDGLLFTGNLHAPPGYVLSRGGNTQCVSDVVMYLDARAYLDGVKKVTLARVLKEVMSG
jgi:hypothetical protein